MRLLAADPGLEGAIIFCDVNEGVGDGGDDYVISNVRIYDMPVTECVDKRRLPCPVKIAELINMEGGVDAVIVEKVGPRPRGGRASEWRFAMGYGVLLACVSHDYDALHLVDPATWKRKMGVTADKKTSLKMANSLLDRSGADPIPKSRDGRAEAYLLAHYYARYVMMIPGRYYEATLST